MRERDRYKDSYEMKIQKTFIWFGQIKCTSLETPHYVIVTSVCSIH